jgi:hypothetical protein
MRDHDLQQISGLLQQGRGQRADHPLLHDDGVFVIRSGIVMRRQGSKNGLEPCFFADLIRRVLFHRWGDARLYFR